MNTQNILSTHATALAQTAEWVHKWINEALIVMDADGAIQNINPAFTELTGYKPTDVFGQRIDLLCARRRDHSDYQTMWSDLSTTGHWSGNLWVRRESGEAFIAFLKVGTLYNADTTVNMRIGLLSDTAQSRHQEAQVWHQANYDYLTQLPNRQMFYQNLRRSIWHSRQSGLPFALVFLDLDLFKEVNDSHGHDEGDELLRLVAHRLNGCVRGTDSVARLGGDEFTLILQDMKESEHAWPIIQKVLDTLAQPFRLRDAVVQISVSAGVTFFPHHGADGVDLLKHADLAMYSAKEKGRNQYCVFADSMQKAALARRELLHDMKRALEENQFTLYYQPIVDMQSGHTAKAEALIRWHHPTHGLVGPRHFIEQAEDAGLIVPIGNWVFYDAARQVAEWREKISPDFEVSINVSPVQFRPDGLQPQAWVDALQALGLPGSAVLVEITERLLMQANIDSSTRLLAFRDAGIQVALDDFGTGHSSLAYLKRFHIDYLKIDQSFVRGLTRKSDDRVLCQAIIVMAHKLGLKVIAEGIGTQEQHAILKEDGCDYGQGFWYCRPIPADQLTSRLQLEQG